MLLIGSRHRYTFIKPRFLMSGTLIFVYKTDKNSSNTLQTLHMLISQFAPTSVKM